MTKGEKTHNKGFHVMLNMTKFISNSRFRLFIPDDKNFENENLGYSGFLFQMTHKVAKEGYNAE